jgi:hypothetical protein
MSILSYNRQLIKSNIAIVIIVDFNLGGTSKHPLYLLHLLCR